MQRVIEDEHLLENVAARGLMVYPMGGTIDGRLGDHVLPAPPFICTPNDIDRIVERLGDAIDAALVAIGAPAARTR